jgi:chemotaxis protein CheC
VRREAERLRELGSIGAGHAASALASLFGRVVWMEPAKGRTLAVRELASALFPPSLEVAAVFVDLSGAARGVAGLLVPASDLEAFLRLLPGRAVRDLSSPRGRSALGEVGNIALCAAAGAIAKLVGGVVLPSVPRVALGASDALLAWALQPLPPHLDAYLVETDLAVRFAASGRGNGGPVLGARVRSVRDSVRTLLARVFAGLSDRRAGPRFGARLRARLACASPSDRRATSCASPSDRRATSCASPSDRRATSCAPQVRVRFVWIPVT